MVAHVLQMELADEACAVAGVGKGLHERRCAIVEWKAAKSGAMDRRHSTGRKGCTIRHTDRVRYDSALEDHRLFGESVQVWGDKTFIEAAEVIAPMLIGDDEHDVWSSRVGLAALGWLVFVHVPGGLAGVVRDVVLRACRRPSRVAQGIGLPSRPMLGR